MSTGVAQDPGTQKTRRGLERAVIRFAGDSGDGMQVTGEQFTTESAVAGNDIATLPNFPAEIRAPAGTLFGVSSFQLQFGSQRVRTPGDHLDCLVAMNPAALKVHLPDLKPGGLLLVNTLGLRGAQPRKGGLREQSARRSRARRALPPAPGRHDPPHDAGARGRAAHVEGQGALQELLRAGPGVVDLHASARAHASIGSTGSSARTRRSVDANTTALKAGHAYGETAEIFEEAYHGRASGSAARALPRHHRQPRAGVGPARRGGALLAAGGLRRVSDHAGFVVLEELAQHKRFGIRTMQAEDEIAAVTAAIGASFGGAIGVTCSSGPGICAEGRGHRLGGDGRAAAGDLRHPARRAVARACRPRPSRPTCCMALYGRNSESPVVGARAVDARAIASTMAYEAVRIAIKYMAPVIVLSDGYLANGSEPWLIPDVAALPPIDGRIPDADGEGFMPYMRDPKTLARPWVRPGTPGLEHRVGGIEKQDGTGNISYDPENHDHMVRMRAAKIAARGGGDPADRHQRPETGDLLVVGWGGTYGRDHAPRSSARRPTASPCRAIHLRHLNPLPPDLGDILRRFDKVLVPEINSGQLIKVLRGGVPGRRARLQQGSRVCRSSRRSSTRRSSTSWESDHEPASRHPDAAESHEEGLRVRPGRALVPGLRRLRDPGRRAEGDARPRHPEGEHRLRLRHRLLEPLPLLHEHVGLPHHPRARAGHRHGARASPGRS